MIFISLSNRQHRHYLDLKDFFPSIKFYRVLGFFRSVGYNDEMSQSLAEICTYRGKLPQGAPTSPAIANLIAWHIDRKLSVFCHKRDLNYSRYADDITISGGHKLPKYKTLIFNKIEEEGFQINFDKVRINGRGSCQKVTGVVVNDKLSIGKYKKKKIRSIVHKIMVDGPCSANKMDDPFFREKIFGLLSYANMIEPDFAQPLINKLYSINWNDYSLYVNSEIESELCSRSLKKLPHSNIIDFDRLKPFNELKPVPHPIKIDSEFKDRLKNLLEKCGNHGVDNCSNCLGEKSEEYEKCMKYILGYYIGQTGGHHHGQEMYDIGEILECLDSLDCLDFKAFVAFLLKSQKNTSSNNSLFTQFHDCAYEDAIDIVAIVTQYDLDHKLYLRIMHVMRDCPIEKSYCLICKKQMEMILYDFIQNYSLKK